MTAALGPVLIWHATPARRFSWFGFGEEFVVRLPESWQPAIHARYTGVGCAWVGRQLVLCARTAATYKITEHTL
jgi:hypothetical protein